MKNQQENNQKATSAARIDIFGIDLDKFNEEVKDGSLEFDLNPCSRSTKPL